MTPNTITIMRALGGTLILSLTPEPPPVRTSPITLQRASGALNCERKSGAVTLARI